MCLIRRKNPPSRGEKFVSTKNLAEIALSAGCQTQLHFTIEQARVTLGGAAPKPWRNGEPEAHHSTFAPAAVLLLRGAKGSAQTRSGSARRIGHGGCGSRDCVDRMILTPGFRSAISALRGARQ
jgi:CO/xanthine dehydrogenase FAD-binding subunit